MREPAVAEFIDTIEGVFFGFDEDGGVVVWNPAAVEVTGYPEAALQEQTFRELFDHESVRSGAEPGDDGVFEGTLVTADGEAVPYEFEVRRLSGDGSVAFAAIGRNITDRRHRRERVVNRERILREMYEIIADRERSFEQQVEALLALGRAELGTAYGSLSRIEGDQYVFERVDAADDAIEAGDVVPLRATNCEKQRGTRVHRQSARIRRQREARRRGGSRSASAICPRGSPSATTARGSRTTNASWCSSTATPRPPTEPGSASTS